MSKERESRRRSPGIIARLMGMEGLPLQQPTHKEHKRSLDSYQRRTESVGPMTSNNQYEGYSYRKGSREEQEFKDVFEVVETTDGYNSRYPVDRNADSKLTVAKMAFFRQKVMDAKRFSTDEYLQVSKEFDDTLEVLESNKDLFLRCLQERNSLFSKHLHDLQNPSAQSHNRHAMGRKTLEPRKSGRNGICLVPDRETTIRTTSSSQRDYDGYLSHPYPSGTHDTRKSSSFPLIGEDDTSTVPTRIVVLKPSIGRAQTSSKYVSSHPSNSIRSDIRMQNELSNVEGRRTVLGRTKTISPDEGLSRQKSQQSREITKQITRRMQSSLGANSFNFPSSRFKGYAGDESSCYVSGNESETESEMTTNIRRQSFDWNDWRGISSSHSSGSSSVNKEAKKRLSKRWNMGHNPEEMVLAERNSTLGEMLAISDMMGKAKRIARTSDQDGRRDRFASIQKSVEGVRPLGISSKEGWYDGYIKNLSRSRSLPATSSAFQSAKGSKRHGTLSNDSYLIPNDTINPRKAVKRHSNHRSGSSSRISRLPATKSKAYHYADSEDNDTVYECLDGQNQVKNVPVENVPSDQNLFLSETSISNFTEPSVADGALVSSEVEVEVEHKDVILSSESLSDLLAHRSGSILPIRDDSSTQDSDNPTDKETSNEPSEEGPASSVGLVLESESLSSPKEAEQPSPVSVLEAPFLNDPPFSTDCFDNVCADLQGLRVQLQLLRLESKEYEEGMIITISSDEEKMDESVHLTEGIEMLMDESSWESSFMADVLISSGFGSVEPATFISTWYSSECPIDPSLFQRLEDKYCNQSNWSRCEAKLLFDRINSGLVDNVQHFIDPHPWLKPSSRQVYGTRSEVTLKDDLYKLLERQETKLNMEDLSEAVVKKEPKWLHLEDDIYEISIELENQLIDELVSEVVTL